MGGKHPKSIITDQDKANKVMKAAIAEVFPNTRHRNYFFHVKYKCYNKNGRCFATKKGLMEEFEDIVNNSVTKQEFEVLWQKMIEEHQLQENKFFALMWETRERFIPVYFKEDFFPFLQSTGRSEGTNARLKENVGPTYSIINFLREFKRMVDTTNIREHLEDNISKQKRPKELIYGYNIERQAMELYNRNIFKKFQFQLQLTDRLKYKEIEKGKRFEVWPKTNQIYKPHRMREYIVLTDLTKGNEKFSCLCGKFSKDGILCSHILKVLVEEEVNEIPEKYIIDRWRKKDRKMNLPVPDTTAKTHELLRFNILSRRSAILNSKGSKTEEAAMYLTEEYDRINTQLELMLSTPNAVVPSTQSVLREDEIAGGRNTGNLLELGELNDPDKVKQKARLALPKRLKPLVEEIRRKVAREEKKKAAKKPAAKRPAAKSKIID